MDSFVPLDRSLQHILAGTVLFVPALVVARLRRSPLAWYGLAAVILAFALAAEAIDLYDDGRTLGYRRWHESVWDILMTMLVPVIATLLRVRRRRRSN